LFIFSRASSGSASAASGLVAQVAIDGTVALPYEGAASQCLAKEEKN
jgi:hypothetical protein